MSLAASVLVTVTLTTGLALATTRLLPRRGRASVRHLVLAATFAILVALPVATVFAPPIRIVVPVAAPSAAPRAVATMTMLLVDEAARPAATTSAARRLGTPSVAAIVLTLWFAGALLFLAPIAAGLWETRALRRTAQRWTFGESITRAAADEAGLRRSIDVLLHQSIPGPMTTGLVRPAILLPADASDWKAADLHRAIIHEVEHVRRGDWLTQSITRLITAAYWFHPLVWAAWRQFVLEAERACDDAVVRRADPDAYADQLVALAHRMVDARGGTSPAMAGRSDLLSRVRAVLDQHQRRDPAGVVGVGIAGALAAAIVTLASPLRIVAVAQPPAAGSPPTFEVASVKPCRQEPDTGGQRRQEWRMTSPGHVIIECIPLRRIIFFAYAGIGNLDNPLLNTNPNEPDLVRNGPGWLETDKWTIDAKAEGTPDRTVMMGAMLRTLLENRFHLKSHRETEQATMLALTVMKAGMKITSIGPDGCRDLNGTQNLSNEEVMAINTSAQPMCGNFTAVGDGANRTWRLGGTTLEKFAHQTLSSVLDYYVLDKTGVQGRFNIVLTFGVDESIRRGVFGGAPLNGIPADIERGPSIFTALEEQLGLKLEKTKGPRQFLVVDSVSRPEPD